MTSVPVVIPRPPVDLELRALRRSLVAPAYGALRAGNGVPVVFPAKALIQQRGKPIFPLDGLDVTKLDADNFARTDHSAATTEYMVKEAGEVRTAAHARMRSGNDMALAAIAFRPESERTVIRSATINMGQLDIAGLIKVAHATQRREFYTTVLADLLHGKGGRSDSRNGITVPAGPPDVIECQEVWLAKARTALRNAAEANDYVCVLPDNVMKRYGLQLLIRKRPDFKRIVESGIIELKDNDGWSLRAAFDRIWGSKRGLAYAIIELANGETVCVSTAHLSPLPQYVALRERQFEAMAEVHNALAARTTYAIHGSDTNTPDSTEGATESGLAYAAQGVLALHRFMDKTGLRDAWASVDSKNNCGTMNHHFSQFLEGEYNMRGKRIDYQLAGAKAGKWIGALDYRTRLGSLYPTGDGTQQAFSDHMMIQATYVLA